MISIKLLALQFKAKMEVRPFSKKRGKHTHMHTDIAEEKAVVVIVVVVVVVVSNQQESK